MASESKTPQDPAGKEATNIGPADRPAVPGRQLGVLEPNANERTNMSYALTTTVHRSFADTLDATRVSLTDQGSAS